MKKIFISIISTLLPLMVNAAIEYHEVWYNLNDNDHTAEVVSSQGSQYTGDISISYQVYYKKTFYTVTSIDNSAFEGCVDVTSVSIPSCVINIGNAAFYSCTGLETINIPNGVKTIGEGAFSKCGGLSSVTIPNSVTSIGINAFFQCYGLTQINSLIENPFTINDNVFPTSVYSNAKLSVPCGKVVAYQTKSSWKRFANIVEIEFEDNGIQYKIGEDNTVSVISKTEKYSGDIIIPNQVEYNGNYYTVSSIGQSAFEECTGLTCISIPSGVKTLEQGAFYGCSSLTYVKIPEGVTKIGLGAFSKCSNLTSVIIPSTVTTIDKYAFDYCTSLSHIVSVIQQPNVFEDNVFDTHSSSYSVYSQATLVVPDGAKATYNSKSGWKNFTNIKEASEQKSLTIHVDKAGTLPDLISDIEKYQIEELTLSGELNGTDIRFIRELSGIDYGYEPNCMAFCKLIDIYTSGKLEVLDITNANIVSGGAYYYGWTLDKNNEYEELKQTETNTISDHMFYECHLETVKLPNSITSIEVGSLIGCSGLTSITIGNSVTSIEHAVFSGCNSLSSIVVESGNTKYDSRGNCNAIVEKTSNTLVVGCKNTIIPNSVTSIGDYAFAGCSGLTSINIPNSVTSIGEWAFEYCNNLTSVVSEIETPFAINGGVFYNNLKDIYATAILIVPTGKKSIYQNTAGWSKFKFIIESDEIGQEFEVDGIRYKIGEIFPVSVISKTKKYSGDIVIPNQVEYNGNIFAVTSIGQSAFEGCVDMTSVSIPSSVTVIDDGAFYSCTGLETIDIPNGVMTIGEGAFSKCSGLSSVTIPNSVTSIGINAFFQCYGLTQINSLIENPFKINDNVFPTSVYSNAKLSVPCGKTADYQAKSSWKRFANIFDVIGQVFNYERINYRIGGNNTVSVARVDRIEDLSGDIVIPIQVPYYGLLYTVTSIEDYAFCSCDVQHSCGAYYGGLYYEDLSMTSITIPSSIISIGLDAFSDRMGLKAVYITDLEAWCNISFSGSESNPLSYAHHLYLNGTEIKDLVIPQGVTSISSQAFWGCSGLTSVTIPNSVTSIGWGAFTNCNNLNSIHITDLEAWCKIGFGFGAPHLFLNGTEIKDLVIPNSLTSIGGGAFTGCSGLTSVNIHNSVTSIGNSAFSYCNGLTSVIIGNGVISIGDYALYGCSNLTSIIALNYVPPTCASNSTFEGVDKEECMLWVPKGSLAAYKNADEWKEFKNIREIITGDVKLDGEVNKDDLDTLVAFIMGETAEDINEDLVDLNGDKMVNAADVVKLVTILNIQDGLSTDWQPMFNGSQVITSLACTLNNNWDNTIQVTKCELYYNQSLVSYATFNVTLASGESKKCSFDNLVDYSAKKDFSVVWHCTYNGEKYTNRFNLPE